jgi:hypothetical protein
MQKFLITIIAFLFFGVSLFAQLKEYKLVSKTSNADLSQRAIFSIDTTKIRETRQNVFNPTKGNYTVYMFIATFKGQSFDNTEKDFHDILVLKTDKKKQILEAYQYTLEWAEMPFSYDLYQATAKGVALINRLPIEKLKFRKADDPENSDGKLNEQGLLIY